MLEFSTQDTEVPSTKHGPSTLFRTILLLTPMALLVAGSYFLWHTDPDYWWHVRTGQVIWEMRSLPAADIFSYTAAGQPWITHEWLTQVAFFLVEHHLGYSANVVIFGLLGGMAFLTIYATARLWDIGQLGAALLALLAFVVGAGSANVRPQMITVLLLAIMLWLLTRARVKHSLRGLWLLPFLFLLWVNLHGGYVIGLALLWVTVLGEAIAARRRRPAIALRILLPAAALSTLAVLISPHGLDALFYPFSYAGTSNASMRYIKEWQSPDFHLPWLLSFAAVLLLTTAIGLGGAPLGVSQTLWVLVLGFLALQSVRHIPLYAVAVMPLLGARLLAPLPVLGRTLDRWRRATPLLAFWLVIVVLALWAWSMKVQGRFTPQTGQAPSETTYPAEGVAFLRNHEFSGNLFNEYAWGGYLIYQLYPQQQVFIDGRADVYGDALMDRYGEVAGVQPGWRQVLDDYDVDIVLIAKGSPLAVLLENADGWERSFEGSVEVIFVRAPGD